MVAWDHVTRDDVLRAIQEYDRTGPDQFFAEHGFGPSRSYELVWENHHYPHKAILGTAYELATGQRLAAGDFEGGKRAPCGYSASWDSRSSPCDRQLH